MIRLSLVYFQRMKAAKRWRTCYRISVNYIPVFSCLFVISYFAVGFLQIHLFYWFGWFVDLYDVFDGHWYNIIKTLFCRLLELFNWSWFHQGLNWFKVLISCQTVYWSKGQCWIFMQSFIYNIMKIVVATTQGKGKGYAFII